MPLIPTYEISTPEEAEKIETARRSLAAHAERMRLRDQFAAAALTGLVASGAMLDVAQRAYKAADAMLAAREAK